MHGVLRTTFSCKQNEKHMTWDYDLRIFKILIKIGNIKHSDTTEM